MVVPKVNTRCWRKLERSEMSNIVTWQEGGFKKSVTMSAKKCKKDTMPNQSSWFESGELKDLGETFVVSTIVVEENSGS